ncbi:MAG: AMP-binding protein [Spirochaetes bacterium]|nr:AMP-binding protein [Spirochaetota bacterium]
MNEKKPWTFLEEYRGTRFSGEWPTLPELFAISAGRFPASACFTIYDPDRRTLDYRAAFDLIRRVAGRLVADGVKPDDKVAVTGKNAPEWAVAYLAVLAAGAVVVPIDYQLKDDEIVNLVRASDSKVLFSDEERFDQLKASCPGLRDVHSLSKAKPGYIYDIAAKDPIPLVPRKCEDLAAILYTSGTTGNPKGVMLTHGNFVSDCFLAQANLTILSSDVFYALLPIHHSYTMLAVFMECFSVGAELVFGQKLVVKQILSDLRNAKVTMFLGVPLLFNKVLAGIMRGIKEKGPAVYGLIRFLMAVSGFVKKAFRVNPGKSIFHSVLDKASLATNRICISGGGPLASSVFRQYNQLGIDFVQGYGLTETSPIITLNPVDHYKETSVGKLIPRVEMKILDPDEHGVGEIAVKGPMVMQGYYKNPEATAEVITEDGWFRTGDVGYMDSENYVYLTGRAKSLIVTEGGKNVYPEEIENRFQLFTEVEQVLVRGYELDKAMKIEGIEALVYPNREAFGNSGAAVVEARMKAVVEEVNKELLPYQKIQKVTVLDEPLEMTTTKKIKRFAAAS